MPSTVLLAVHYIPHAAQTCYSTPFLRKLPFKKVLDLLLYKIVIGRVGVGWQRRCKTFQALRELLIVGNHGTFFLAVTMAGGRVR